VLAVIVAAALWWCGTLRRKEPLHAKCLHSLATGYLMLFNPMNEANTYVILAPALGFWAVHWLSNPATATRGWTLVVMTLSMSLLPNLVRPLFGNHFALIWHPTMTLLFGILLTLFVWQRNHGQANSPLTGLSPA